jgi:hypothetical protein
LEGSAGSDDKVKIPLATDRLISSVSTAKGLMDVVAVKRLAAPPRLGQTSVLLLLYRAEGIIEGRGGGATVGNGRGSAYGKVRLGCGRELFPGDKDCGNSDNASRDGSRH